MKLRYCENCICCFGPTFIFFLGCRPFTFQIFDFQVQPRYLCFQREFPPGFRTLLGFAVERQDSGSCQFFYPHGFQQPDEGVYLVLPAGDLDNEMS